MPIYEFRCTACGNIQEIIVTNGSEEVEMKCRECQCEDLERVLSRVSYAMGDSGSSGAQAAGPSCTSRSCGSGNSCSTIELPGYSR
jgi:putative FmdB family regulatory protein